MSGLETRSQTCLRKLVPTLKCVLLCAFAAVWSGPSFAQSGNFLTAVNYPVPGQGGLSGSQNGLAIGDFNGDKVPDIVVANGDSTVSILIGNGDGTFKTQYLVTAVPTSSSLLTEWVAVGDFNGDGFADLAVLCVSSLASDSTITGSINILLNKADGSGTFGAPTVIPIVGTNPAVVLAAHFGSDLNYDLAVLNVGTANVGILLGKGNGTFQPEVDYATGSQPAALAIGDVNKDGFSDLAVAGTSGSDGVVTILLGNADGTFQVGVNWITASSSCTETCFAPTAVVIGDFNGDGKLDLAVNDGGVGGIFVLLGNGDGTFQTPPLHSANAAGPPNAQNTLVAGDWNGDGKLDLAESVLSRDPALADTELFIYLGNGDATFPFPLTLGGPSWNASFGSANSIVAADVNGDGFPDLILSTNSGFVNSFPGDAVTVVLNCGLRCSSTNFTVSPATSSFNQPVTLSAAVTPGNAKSILMPTGSVAFQDQPSSSSPPTALGTASLSGGQATLVLSDLSVGFHSIFAIYQGDSNFDTSTSSAIAQTVAMDATTTSIASSVDPSAPGQSVTITAMVTPSTSGVPTGTVVLTDNGTQTISSPLDSTGSATFTSSGLSTGTHSLTWSYSGDPNFVASTSPVLTQIVGTNAAPFTLSSSSTSASVSAGQSAMFTITVASVPSQKGAITFACAGLPTGASCIFTPNPVAPNGATATVALIVVTTGSMAALPLPPGSWQWQKTRALFGALGILASILLVGTGPKMKVAPSAFAFLSLLIILTLAVACSSNTGNSGSPQNVTPSGTSNLMVTASSGSATQSVTISLTVH